MSELYIPHGKVIVAHMVEKFPAPASWKQPTTRQYPSQKNPAWSIVTSFMKMNFNITLLS